VDAEFVVRRSSHAERAALVALLNIRPGNRSWPELTALVLERGEVESLLDDLDPAELFPSPDQLAVREQALADVHVWDDEDLDFLTILDDRYPAPVREIHQAPPFLFARAELRASDPAVSVVGSRKASDRGLAMARSVAQALVEFDISAVSGLALGIDTAAHEAALAAGGRPVGIIGTGIRRAYPAAGRACTTRSLRAACCYPNSGPTPTRKSTLS